MLGGLSACTGSDAGERDGAQKAKPRWPPLAVEVTVRAPGLTADEVEAIVVRPLERAVRDLELHVDTEARAGLARLELRGSVDQTLLIERLIAAHGEMPPAVEAPTLRVLRD